MFFWIIFHCYWFYMHSDATYDVMWYWWHNIKTVCCWESTVMNQNINVFCQVFTNPYDTLLRMYKINLFFLNLFFWIIFHCYWFYMNSDATYDVMRYCWHNIKTVCCWESTVMNHNINVFRQVFTNPYDTLLRMYKINMK